jgi:hypothetical protein
MSRTVAARHGSHQLFFKLADCMGSSMTIL